MIITYSVKGMTCGGCVASITRVVKGLDPNASVDADLAAKRVKISSAIKSEAVIAAISGAGFHPHLA